MPCLFQIYFFYTLLYARYAILLKMWILYFIFQYNKMLYATIEREYLTIKSLLCWKRLIKRLKRCHEKNSMMRYWCSCFGFHVSFNITSYLIRFASICLLMITYVGLNFIFRQWFITEEYITVCAYFFASTH